MKRSLLTNQHGASMVEFALILPIFLALLIGIIEFSLLFFDKAVLTNATREGARTGILYRDGGVPVQEIRDRVKQYCAEYLITFKDTVVLTDANIDLMMSKSGGAQTAYDPSTFESGDILTVNVTYPYTFLILPDVKGLLDKEQATLPGDIIIAARTSMQGE